MTTYNCDHCLDTGKRLMPYVQHSDYVDCSCQAATERAELDVAVTVFVQSYEGDLQNAPADTRWFVHQRAVKMQAAKVAALQAQVKELEQKHANTVQRYEELAAMPSAPAVEQASHQRDMLAKGIAAAALKAGIWNGETDLTGPHLLMFCDDLAEAAAPQAADTDKVREALDGLHNDIMNLPHQMPITKYAVGTEAFIAYKEGHRDARHAAAELCNAASMAVQAPVREVPEGWQLVPKVPPKEMLTQMAASCTCDHCLTRRYQSMLAAAPLPAAPVQQEDE